MYRQVWNRARFQRCTSMSKLKGVMIFYPNNTGGLNEKGPKLFLFINAGVVLTLDNWGIFDDPESFRDPPDYALQSNFEGGIRTGLSSI